MQECKHEPVIGLDNIIKCKLCGEAVYELIIASGIQSSTRARRILDEIAVAGDYKAISVTDKDVVYGNGTFELTTRKIAERRYEVIKRKQREI